MNNNTSNPVITNSQLLAKEYRTLLQYAMRSGTVLLSSVHLTEDKIDIDTNNTLLHSIAPATPNLLNTLMKIYWVWIMV